MVLLVVRFRLKIRVIGMLANGTYARSTIKVIILQEIHRLWLFRDRFCNEHGLSLMNDCLQFPLISSYSFDHILLATALNLTFLSLWRWISINLVFAESLTRFNTSPFQILLLLLVSNYVSRADCRCGLETWLSNFLLSIILLLYFFEMSTFYASLNGWIFWRSFRHFDYIVIWLDYLSAFKANHWVKVHIIFIILETSF